MYHDSTSVGIYVPRRSPQVAQQSISQSNFFCSDQQLNKATFSARIIDQTKEPPLPTSSTKARRSHASFNQLLTILFPLSIRLSCVQSLFDQR
jgi:hypothetical protein